MLWAGEGFYLDLATEEHLFEREGYIDVEVVIDVTKLFVGKDFDLVVLLLKVFWLKCVKLNQSLKKFTTSKTQKKNYHNKKIPLRSTSLTGVSLTL